MRGSNTVNLRKSLLTLQIFGVHTQTVNCLSLFGFGEPGRFCNGNLKVNDVRYLKHQQKKTMAFKMYAVVHVQLRFKHF